MFLFNYSFSVWEKLGSDCVSIRSLEAGGDAIMRPFFATAASAAVLRDSCCYFLYTTTSRSSVEAFADLVFLNSTHSNTSNMD